MRLIVFKPLLGIYLSCIVSPVGGEIRYFLPVYIGVLIGLPYATYAPNNKENKLLMWKIICKLTKYLSFIKIFKNLIEVFYLYNYTKIRIGGFYESWKEEYNKIPKSFFKQEKPTMSTKEALQDVVPLLTLKEMKKIKQTKKL